MINDDDPDIEQEEIEPVPPFWTRVGRQLPTLLVSLAVIGGTVVLGVGPLVIGSVSLGKQIGVPVGAGVAAVAMMTVLWAAMRYRDVPGGWVAGLLAFVNGTLMLLLAPIVSAQALIPSRPTVAGVIGAVVGGGLVAGLILIGKRRDLLWPKSMGSPGPYSSTYGLGGG